MRIAILHGAHSNYHALKSVMEHMSDIGVDKKVFIGDYIGLGAKPEEVAKLVHENFDIVIAGSYDLAVVDENILMQMTSEHQIVMNYAKGIVSEDTKAKILSHSSSVEYNGICFTYGKPIQKNSDALSVLGSNEKSPITFTNSNGIPMLWTFSDGVINFERVRVINQTGNIGVRKYELDPDNRYIVDVGSVGRPKDGDFRASYCIYDSQENSVTFYRIPYDNHKAVIEMQMADFPQSVWRNALYGN